MSWNNSHNAAADQGAAEIARIRAEYERRSQAIPRDFYAWSRPANYFLHSQTAPGGLILWYDFRFNNPRNPHVRGIGAVEIRDLFPACPLKGKRATLAPPIARPVVSLSWDLGLVLEHLPFLNSHYLAVIRKP